MAFVSGPKGNIYYDLKGQGEPIVMLRGLGRSSRYWLGYDEYLARYFRVITVDYRGIGRSTAPMSWLTTIEDMAGDVKQALDELGISSSHIFGLSLGGMVAMALASKFPNYCKGLIIANASTADSSSSRIALPAVRELARAALTGKSLQKTLMHLVTTERVEGRIGNEILDRWHEIIADEGMPVTTVLKQLLAASRFRIKGRIDAYAIPTLILYGNQDKFVPCANSKKLSRLIEGSELKSIRGVGHEITIGQEELLTKIIKGFALSPNAMRQAI